MGINLISELLPYTDWDTRKKKEKARAVTILAPRLPAASTRGRVDSRAQTHLYPPLGCVTLNKVLDLSVLLLLQMQNADDN